MALAAIAVAALIIGACADRGDGASRLFTEPGWEVGKGDAQLNYVATASASVVDPRTHRLQPVRESVKRSPGVSASITAGGTGSLLLVPFGSPGLAKTSGYYAMRFTDQSLHKHTVILLYSLFGGPPAAMQHYVDGAISSTTTYSWKKVTAGWLRTTSFTRAVRSGTLVGTYSTTTTTTTGVPPSGGGGPAIPVRLEHQPQPNGVQRLLNSVAYSLAFTLAPQDASAQIVSPAIGACLQEWLKYAAAAGVVVGIEALIAEAPVLTPFLAAQLATALALLGAAEDLLLNCLISHQPGTFMFFGGGGGGAGAGSGGGDSDCLAGSYAAHCTTPFTL
ncbi:MAG TPA: hypothetical protein VK617_15520 [Gemmatimonadaceae bacterium]|nr:hypothetical protein [Gemmatimonadaceae bacterium]